MSDRSHFEHLEDEIDTIPTVDESKTTTLTSGKKRTRKNKTSRGPELLPEQKLTINELKAAYNEQYQAFADLHNAHVALENESYYQKEQIATLKSHIKDVKSQRDRYFKEFTELKKCSARERASAVQVVQRNLDQTTSTLSDAQKQIKELGKKIDFQNTELIEFKALKAKVLWNDERERD